MRNRNQAGLVRPRAATVGKDRERLEQEKTAALAELERDQVARHLSDDDRRAARATVRNANNQLARWR